MKALPLFLALLGTPVLCFAEVPQHTEVCVAASKDDIAALFNRWNAAVKTGDPQQVVANYAEKSVLLATVSSKPRLTPSEKEDYFQHFLRNQPEGHIDSRTIELDCNTAIDEGQYSFFFKTTGVTIKARYTFIYKWDGKQWLIIGHHSSKVPSEQAPLEDPPHTIAQHSEVCVAADEQSIIALFDRWKESIESNNAHKVMANYAARSVLLPLSSTTPRLTLDDNEDYYRHFLKDRPLVHVHSRIIEIDCNMAIDEGLYAFNFQKTGTIVNARYSIVYKWDGMQWLITSDHSSLVP
jgi:uncharacterized protein (TIGR02246 family)